MDNAFFISDYRVYMTPLRAVICPNGEILFMNKGELEFVPDHLFTWALKIAPQVIDQ